MNQYSKSLLYISIIQLILIFVLSFSPKFTSLDYFLGNMGTIYILSIPLLLLIGVVCLFINEARIFGQAALTMVAISLLFGVGLCSIGTFRL